VGGDLLRFCDCLCRRLCRRRCLHRHFGSLHISRGDGEAAQLRVSHGVLVRVVAQSPGGVHLHADKGGVKTVSADGQRVPRHVNRHFRYATPRHHAGAAGCQHGEGRGGLLSLQLDDNNCHCVGGGGGANDDLEGT